MGQKYAAFNATGKIIGYYDSVDSPVPAGTNAIPISDQQWQLSLKTPGGFIITNKIFTANTVPASVNVAATLVQLAQTALKSGVQIISDSTPTISSTYAIDPTSLSKVMNIAMYISMNNAFPGKQATISVMDIGKIARVFPTTALFLAFSVAISDYASLLDSVVNGTSTTLPQISQTII